MVKKIIILFLTFLILYPYASFQSQSQILSPQFLLDLSVESIDPAPSSPVVYDNVTIKILIKN
ncbi:MAG: hypothetical protein ACQXXF_05260, partial [Thermoplasmatota archaeon]